MIRLLTLTLFTLFCSKVSILVHLISQFVSYGPLSLALFAFTASVSFVVVPKFVQEATSIPSWKVALEEEMFALSQNASWALVFPPGKTTVGRC